MIRRPTRPLHAALIAACLLAGPAHALPLTIEVVDERDRPLEHAVASVYVKGAPTRAPAGTGADLGQRNKSFAPYVLAVQTGTAVSFPNFDTVRHHVYSFSTIRAFEIKLYVGTPVAPVVFDKAGTAVLGCNIHDQMAAFVHVVDTPYFGRSEADGRVQLDTPAGEHRVRVWHPRMQAGGAPVERTIKVAPGDGPVRIRLPEA